LNFRINNTHTFLAGGFAYVTEAFDPLDKPRPEKPNKNDDELLGLIPRKETEVRRNGNLMIP